MEVIIYIVLGVVVVNLLLVGLMFWLMTHQLPEALLFIVKELESVSSELSGD